MGDALIPRLQNENAKWFSRFLVYLSMAPENRSIIGTYRLEKALPNGTGNLPGSWNEAVHRFQWQKRAADFDERQTQLELQEFSKARREEARKKFAVLKQGRVMIQKMLKSLNDPQKLGNATFADLSRLVQVVFNADRDASATLVQIDTGLKRGGKDEDLTPEQYATRVRMVFSFGGANALDWVGSGREIPDEHLK